MVPVYMSKLLKQKIDHFRAMVSGGYTAVKAIQAMCSGDRESWSSGFNYPCILKSLQSNNQTEYVVAILSRGR